MSPTRIVLLCVLVGACGGAETHPAEAPRATKAAPLPMSDPAEYRAPQISSAAGEETFTRTGIGDPYRTGIPYPVFLALLSTYPSELGADVPQLAARFGFLARAAEPSSADLDRREGLPFGMHLTVDPFTRVPFLVTSCALCHVERVRWPGGERVVIGLGNKRVRAHAYDAAITQLGGRADLDRTALATRASAIARERSVPWPAEWRATLVRATADAMRERARVRAELFGRVKDAPPGRIAPIESFALAIGLTLGRTVTTGHDVGWTKVPDVIGFADRTTLSWDGAAEGSLDALVVEADFAIGVRPEWYWTHPKQGPSLSSYLRHLPRDLPFPGPIDRALAERGRAAFSAACARCHGSYGEGGRVARYTERVVPVVTVGTDPLRARVVTDDFVRAANEPSLTHGLLETRRTDGYVPPVLTSIWARAPYGHAGQWPSLAVMATAPSDRATQYVVDLDAPIDLGTVGLPARAPGGPLSHGEWEHDGSKAGLGVGGHPFLADLGPAEAKSVIEYLKTL